MSERSVAGSVSDPMSTLSGRSLLVAGMAGALAPSIARAARDRGAHVALAAPAAGGSGWTDIASVPASFDSEAGADAVLADVVARFPRVDAVIAVVAAETLPALHEVPIECWHRHVTDPLRGAFWLARRAVEEFLAAGTGGRIVLVADAPAAGAERANDVIEEALVSFVRSIAREYGRRGLACNLVLPAAATPGSSAVVEQALFLATPAASFITGAVLRPRPVPMHPSFD